jgi:uncharacterized protein
MIEPLDDTCQLVSERRFSYDTAMALSFPADEAATRWLDELVRRIVAAAQPLRIILFGSAAEGAMGPHSDLDILVVMPDGIDRGRTTADIYRGLYGLGFATDVVVVTASDVERHAANPYVISAL